MASPDEAASGAEPFDVRELQGRIDAVLEREHACWGVLVYSTGLGRDIAAHRPDTALVPASNVKLFTALASLLVSHVGPTRALRTAAHVVDVTGDDTRASSGDAGKQPPRRRAVCVHPCGDPGLTADPLVALVGDALEAAGVSADDVDADRTRLGGDPWRDEGVPDTWEVGDLAHDWAAPPSRAVLDRNVQSLWTPGKRSETGGEPPRQTPLARFREACRDAVRDAQTSGHRADEERATPPNVTKDAKETETETEILCGLAPPAPPRRAGIRSPLFEIPAREPRFPDGWAIRDSAPVSAIARAALRDSDNLCAEQLLRVCAGGRDSGRWLTSWSAVFCRKHCASTGADLGKKTSRGEQNPELSGPEFRTSPAPSRVRFVDGSGLSRHNLAPPRAFVALFLSALEGAAREREDAVAARDELSYGPSELGEARKPFSAFLDALPASPGVLNATDGEESGSRSGTLGSRLDHLRGAVRAKTGSMRGAAALSGYFVSHKCARLGDVAFSVVANNHASAAADARHRLRDALDEIVRLVDRAEVMEEEEKPS